MEAESEPESECQSGTDGYGNKMEEKDHQDIGKGDDTWSRLMHAPIRNHLEMEIAMTMMILQHHFQSLLLVKMDYLRNSSYIRRLKGFNCDSCHYRNFTEKRMT
jgi:hypothetical protein